MTEIVVAVFPTGEAAEAAVRDLEAAGIPSDSIRRHRRDEHATMPQPKAQRGAQTYAAGTHIGNFWSWLIGEEPQGVRPSDPIPSRIEYERSLAAGGTVIAVPVEEAHAERVIDILHGHGPVDLEEHPADTAAPPTSAMTKTPEHKRAREAKVRRFRLDEDTGRVW
jgi:hypothetical protein